MATFHKPKVFRSLEGCCICKTKSSSSRFTDSSKYEDTFRGCFNLGEDRVGEICNACVLLVKRWKKLPKNTKRNWSHVVDARAGPGAKNFVKQKKKDETGEEFEKIRRKHFSKKPLRKNSGEEDVLVTTPDNLEVSSSRLKENKIGDFFDSYYWKRETVRGRDIYRGLMGEIMIDTRSWVSVTKDDAEKVESAAENDDNNNDKVKLSDGDGVPMTVESLIESELRKLSAKKSGEIYETESCSEESRAVVKVGVSVGEQDEGFCDKSSILTGPTSPLSDSVLVSPDLGLEDE